MCGCVKKGTQVSNIQITNSKVFKDRQVYYLNEDLELSANPEILIGLNTLYENNFELIKIINTPFEVYIESQSGDLIDYGYLFYGKYKTNDEIYILHTDFNSKIMEKV